VDGDGRVIGVAEGNATITVTTEDGNYQATCAVTVQPWVSGGDIPGGGDFPPVGITFDHHGYLVFEKGESATLTFTVTSPNATIRYSISGPGADFEEGEVVIDQNGTGTITVPSVTEGEMLIEIGLIGFGGIYETLAFCEVYVFDTTPISVSSTAEWEAAMDTISDAQNEFFSNGEPVVIPRVFVLAITQNISVAGISSNLNNGYRKEVWLTGDKTISLSSSGSLIRTGWNQTFIIDGPTLQGISDNNDALVHIEGGTVELRSGHLKGNTNTGSGNNFGGGGVYVSGGTFTMEGGTISGNTATNDGGGVYFSYGTFTMKDGTISDNTAMGSGGGMYFLYGRFTMEKGTISENKATGDNSNGGGVYVFSNGDGTFTMEGGTISGNTAMGSGGGVYVSTNGTFTMEGGTISGNTATGSGYANGGGGVFVSGGTFTMEGGTISENTTASYGGGVYVSGGTFTMEDGTVEKNTAYAGGGVSVSGTGGAFTMNGGTISENTATSGGGGPCPIW
jgi:hypothetical protein